MHAYFIIYVQACFGSKRGLDAESDMILQGFSTLGMYTLPVRQDVRVNILPAQQSYVTCWATLEDGLSSAIPVRDGLVVYSIITSISDRVTGHEGERCLPNRAYVTCWATLELLTERMTLKSWGQLVSMSAVRPTRRRHPKHSLAGEHTGRRVRYSAPNARQNHSLR